MNDFVSLGSALEGLFQQEETTPDVRLPVLNTEPRVPMHGRKWHIIWERDGGRCWMCGVFVPKGTGEVDHIIPRSSFPLDQLWLADRSDNLKTSCGPCNQAKSNYAPRWMPTNEGVTYACWQCTYCPFDYETNEELYRYWQEDNPAPEMTATAYCDGCATYTWVPDLGWLA